MASGDVATIEPVELPYGSALTYSGRISAVTEPGELSVHYPFRTMDLVDLDDALKYGSRAAKARCESGTCPMARVSGSFPDTRGKCTPLP